MKLTATLGICIITVSIGSAIALSRRPPIAFKNIRLADSNGRFRPCEPTIAVNSRNPDNIVAGVVLDRAYSTKDGGKTWTESTLRSEWGVFGDPALTSD